MIRRGLAVALVAIDLAACGGTASERVPDATADAGINAPDPGVDADAAVEATADAGPDATTPSCPTGTWDHDRDAGTPCVSWSSCEPGTTEFTRPSATSDRLCRACPVETFNLGTNANACTPWSTCAAGHHVVVKPSSTSDRTCEVCGSGSYTSGPNQSVCVPTGACAPGTRQAVAGTSTAPPVCVACEAGDYCAGGTTPPVACSGTTWDNDGDPATACIAPTECLGGQYVSAPPTATGDRQCSPCASGLVSGTTNAVTCVIPAVQVGVSGRHACARLADRTVRCWGGNLRGLLGDGTDAFSRLSPVLVPGLTDVVDLSILGLHSCVVLAGGTMRCWGDNLYGALGDGTRTDRNVPTPVVGIANAVRVVSGEQHSCALLADGTVSCWGFNGDGELGDGSGVYVRPTAGPVTGLGGVTVLASGNSQSCAVTAAGQLACWGQYDGPTGDATTPVHGIPVSVLSDEKVAGVAIGNQHTCALLASGKVRCAGYADFGQLGYTSNNQMVLSFAPVPGALDANAVFAGQYTSCAFGSWGRQCWGDNAFGVYGDGTVTSGATPKLITELPGMTSIAVNEGMACAVFSSGIVQCTGTNNEGQLGDGTRTARTVYAPVYW